MKFYPMTMIVSPSATVTRGEIATELKLNAATISILLQGAAVQVTEDYLPLVDQVNEKYSGQVTLVVGDPSTVGEKA